MHIYMCMFLKRNALRCVDSVTCNTSPYVDSVTCNASPYVDSVT